MKTDYPSSREKKSPPELFTHDLTLTHMKQIRRRSRLAWLIALLVRCAFVVLMGIMSLSAVDIVHAVIFVSNFDQPYQWVDKERHVNDLGFSTEITITRPYSIWVDGGLAQEFITGLNQHGYRVGGVAVQSMESDPSPISISFWSSSNGVPGSRIDGAIILEPNTNYFIVVRSTSEARVQITSSSDEDADTLPGWSIGNKLLKRNGDIWEVVEPDDVGRRIFPADGTPLPRITLSGVVLDSRTIIVSLTKVGEGQFKVAATSSAPSDIVLPITVVNGTIGGGATTVTIPAGSTESNVISVSRTPGTTFPVSVDIGNLPSPPPGYTLFKSPSRLPLQVLDGLSGGPTPVSERTPLVRDAIVAAVPSVNSANDVTEAHLAAIATLRVNHPSGTALSSRPVEFQMDDFAGLTALTTLEIGGHAGIILPDGIFTGLVSLRELSLYNSGRLTSVPNAVLSLTSLTSLNLGFTGLSSLPGSVFDNLTQLTSLDLSGNGLASFPDGVFDQLTVLTYLNLEYNDLTSLPDGVFDNLTSLTRLNLDGLELTSLPDGVFDRLTSLTRLSMRDSLLSSLSGDDFSGLPGLTYLNLSGNRWTSLPAGIFSGLSSLTSLHLERNSVDPLPLTVSLEKVGEGQFKAVAPTGAPFDIVLPLRIRNGSINAGTNTLMIPKGRVESTSRTVTRTPGTTAAVTADIGTLPGLPTGVNSFGASLHQGYTLVKSTDLPIFVISRLASGITPVSERTPQVRDAIVAAVPGINSANEVTEAHLAAITDLDLSSQSITSLKVGDFEGLTGLEELHLGSNQLTILPEDIFDGLTVLTTLRLYGNQLSSLPEDIFDELTSLTWIQLGYNRFTTLPSSIFDGLTKLTVLAMRGNQFTTLPDGIFEELTGLTRLRLEENAAYPLPLTVSLEKVGDNQFKAVAPTGAPFDIVLPLNIANGTIYSGATTITIPAGSLESEPLTVLRTSDRTSTVTVNIGTLPGLPTNHSGYSLVKSDDLPLTFTGLDPVFTPVSERTPQVRDQIVLLTRARFQQGISANNVTPVHVRSITYLSLRNKSITSLKTGDFSGMPSLETLILDNNSITSLPEEVFDGLSALKELWLQSNSLTSLPVDVFEDLSALEKLQLASNSLTSLPEEVFDGLSKLATIDLYNNSLSSLPEEVFDGLSALKTLFLRNNSLSSLPEEVFDGLSNLTSLYLAHNSLTSLPGDVFEGLSNLTSLRLSDNDLTNLPEGIFEGLSNLTSLSMYNNPGRLRVTLSLQKFGEGQFKAVAPTGAPFEMVLPLTVTNGSINGGATSITIPAGSVESEILTVTRASDTTNAVAVDIGTLPGLPSGHSDYRLVKSPGWPLEFTELGGTTLIRVSERTPQVRDAIMANLNSVRVNDMSIDDVSLAHLKAITYLDLQVKSITSLKSSDFEGLTSLRSIGLWNNDLTTLPAGIFEGLTALTTIPLYGNHLTTLPAGIFDGLTALTTISLQSNNLTTLPAGIFDGLTALTTISLSRNDLTTLPAGIFDGLTALTAISLWGNDLTTLPAGIFDGLTALTTIDLSFNDLTTLPAGIFDGLTSLTTLNLRQETTDLSLTVSLEKVADGQFKAVAPTGAPFNIVLPLTVTNGSISGDVTSIMIPIGSVESDVLTVNRPAGSTAAATVDIGTLPRLPTDADQRGSALHQGYELVKSADLPLEVISATAPQVRVVNIPDANLRTKVESALGKTSGDPISPAEMATLTSLTAQDASISNLTGLETATNLTTLKLGDNAVSDTSALAGLTNLTELQLWDNSISNISAVAELTNLTHLYIWGNAISDISALAGLTNLTQLKLSENTISNISILSRLTNLTELSLTKNAISDISALAGLTNLTELRIGNNAITNISAVAKLTNLVWLDAPNNSISDISAVANLTNLTSLMLTGNTISDISTLTGLTKLIELYLGENSILDLSPLAANTGLGANTEIDVQGNPLSYPSISTHIPALQARDVYIDFNNRTPAAPVKISGDSQQSTPSTALANPFVVEVRDGNSATFAGVPVTFAITAGGGTLSVTSIMTSANGRAESTLTLGNTAGTNTVSVSVQGTSQTATFTAVATTTNSTPTFTEGATTTRTVAENTATDVNIGAAIAATDADNDTLIYTLGGTDAASFSIVSTSGQLKTRSALDYETKRTYTVTVAVSDGSLTDTITVTISVTDINELPTDAGVCQVGDVLAPGESCTYPGTDTEFSVLSDGRGQFLFFTSGTGLNIKDTVINGQPYTLAANKLASGSWKIEKIADSTETPGITNTAPTFTEGASTARTVAENTAPGVNIGSAIAATDADNDTLTYTLGGTNAASFGINSTTGQLRTRAALDYETKRSYTVTVTVTDGSFTGTIAVTINVTNVVENSAPAFTESSSTTRSVAENTAAGVNIGTAIAATDAETDTLTYTLSGTDAASFSIVRTSGQLRTRAVLDYETKRSYTVTVTVSDRSFTDTITVTINVTDVADTPVVSTLTPVCDRTPQVRDAIVAAVRGVSDCNDVTDAHLAAIRGLLDLRNKNISALKPGDFDGLSLLQDIRLDRNQLRALPADIFSGLSSLRTLYLGDNQLTSLPADVFSELSALTDLFLHENRLASLPVDLFAGLSALRQINLHTNRLTTLPANVFSGLSSLTQIYLRNNRLTSLPADVFSGLSSLQYLYLDGNHLMSLPSDLFSELPSLIQLLLNKNQMSTLSVGMFRGLTASTQLWLQGNRVDPLPLTISLEKVGGNQFKATVPAGAPFTIVLPLRVANGAISGGANTLTIPQGSVESGRLTVTRTAGTTAAVTVDIGTLPELPTNHQGYQLTRSANLPLEIFSSAANRAPTFTEGASTTRAVAENTAPGVNIGAAITAMDADNDTLTYTLSGTDAASFSINSSTGQLQTKSALDYETKTTYTVTVTVSDGSLTDTITVTINVTDVDEAPTDIGVCKVGDILAPGESCTYPGTDATFSVLDNGHSQWNIPDLPSWLAWINQTSIGGSMRISATINNQDYHFVAEEVSNDSWEIKEIGEDRPEQPETPEQPEQPGDVGETPTLTVSTASSLTEATLHGGVATLTLSGGTYESTVFDIRRSLTVSGITGADFETFSVVRVSDTQATVELEFDGNISTSGTLTFNLDSDAITNYEGAALTSQISVPAVPESVVASTASPLTEATLDESVVTLTLSGRKFEQWTSKIRGAMSVSGITGATFETFSVVRVNDTEVSAGLTFDGNINSDSTLTFTVGADAIAGYDGAALTAQVSVSASEEPVEIGGGTPTLRASTPSPLTEATLNESVVTLTLTGGTYESTTFDIRRSLTVSGITRADFEPFSVVRVSDTQATVELEFDGNISTNSTLTFTLGSDAIANYDGDALTSQISVSALPESVVASTASPLTEATLDESVVTLTLTGATYEIAVSKIRDAVTVSGINGVTMPWHEPDRESNTEITLELEFDGTDFDTNSTLTFTVGADAIAGYDGAALTAQVSVSASEEPVEIGGGTPTLRASTPSPLTEATLNESVVTLTLTGRHYVPSYRDIRSALTITGIDGATYERYGIDRISDTEATVELEFNGDFDTNATLTFTVRAGAIADYKGPALTTQLPVTASTESIVASTDAPLTEATLNGSIVTLTLTGRHYVPSYRDIRSALTITGIDGATYERYGVDRISDTEATVELEFNGDFDTDATLTFTVGAGAIADYNGPALTVQVSVTASTESIVATTASPLTEATLDESVVTLTLTGRNYARSIFDIRDAVTVSGINGVTIPWHDPDRESDTELTLELEFDGTNFDSTSTLIFTVGADAIADYNGPALTAQITVTATEQVLRAPSGISLMHVPLQVTVVDGVTQTIESVGDLYDALGGMNTVNLLITHNPETQSWHSYLGEASRGTSADTVLTDSQGIIADMKAPVSLHLDGDALGSNGSSSITLHPGTNLVGVPLKDPRITRVSDLFALEGIEGNVSAITVLNDGTFQTIEQAGDAGDIPITGGQSFILNAWEETTVAVSGQGWGNVSGKAAAAPVALTGIQLGDTTPILALRGSIVSPVGEWNRMPHLRSGSGFRVIVKNLSTRKSAATMTGDEGGRYQLTVVDTEAGRAAQIGDILEISVRSPDPRIGVQPLRHTVTAEDVKWSRVELGNLIVYEIPTETELLPNYPNPFNPETWIPYRLAEDAFVTLTIYDGSGQVVRTLEVGHQIAGYYTDRTKAAYWDGKNEFGEGVASGVYFYHLSAGRSGLSVPHRSDYSATRKMLIIK